MSDDQTTGDNDATRSPFTDVYQLRMTHAVALFFPAVAQGAIFHSAWWPALGLCGIFALFAALARFRFLVQNTNWFLGSVVWNVIVQIGLVLAGMLAHHLWVPMLGIGWVVVTLFCDSSELSQLEEEWRISARWRVSV